MRTRCQICIEDFRPPGAFLQDHERLIGLSPIQLDHVTPTHLNKVNCITLLAYHMY